MVPRIRIPRKLERSNIPPTIPRNISHGLPKEFIRKAVAQFCDRCGNPYTDESIQVIQENEYSAIIHLSCQKCKTTHLATFVKPLGLTTRMPVNTDLSINEIRKFAHSKVVSSDDVLDVYENLSPERQVSIKEIKELLSNAGK